MARGRPRPTMTGTARMFRARPVRLAAWLSVLPLVLTLVLVVVTVADPSPLLRPGMLVRVALEPAGWWR